MVDKDLEKINENKLIIKKYIDRLYSTTSVNAEGNITEELVAIAKKLGVNELSNLASELGVFGLTECIKGVRSQ